MKHTLQRVHIGSREYWVRTTATRTHGLDWWRADVYDAELLAMAAAAGGGRREILRARVALSEAPSEQSAVAQAVRLARRAMGG